MRSAKQPLPVDPERDAELALAQTLLVQQSRSIARDTDFRFAFLLLFEWMVSLCAATWISPLTWAGRESAVHPHVWLAVWLGGVVASLPFTLAMLCPGSVWTRHVMAASQMLMAGLLVHVMGGRVETHFAYFGLLAFLSFYRDWRVLVTGTLVAGLDHVVRGLFWPQSMYGDFIVPLWRPLEHIGWVLFEVGVLADFIAQNRKAMLVTALSQARLQGESDRVQAQVMERTAELENSEKRYGIMFQDSPIPMWLCDAETQTFVAANQEAVKRYGYSEQQFLGMPVSRMFGDRIEGAIPLWRVRARNGSVTEVEMASHPVAWSGRKSTLILANELSDQKREERDAQEIQLRHNQKLESIGQLASGIAHEINTPTQYVGDNLHFLKDSFVDLRSMLALHESLLPKVQAYPELASAAADVREALDATDAPYLLEEIPKALDQALEGVNRISTLVKAMKEFSHPGQKQKAPANLNRAIESTITVARNEWKYVAELEMDLDPALPPVPCLVSDFNQVVLNMIVNAAHAIANVDRKGALGLIRIQTRSVKGWAEVRIKDTGSGIPIEARERIFDPFFTTKGVGKGTGQGLAIARSVVVDKHGGTIHFETELGKSTEFVIRLPLSVDAPTVAEETGHEAVLLV